MAKRWNAYWGLLFLCGCTIGECTLFEDQCQTDDDCYEGEACFDELFGTVCDFADRCTTNDDCEGGAVCVTVPATEADHPFETSTPARQACRSPNEDDSSTGDPQ